MKRKKHHLKTSLLALGLFCLLPNAYSQSVLETYVNEGLQNNLVLKEKNISLSQSLLALKDAKSYFLPSVDFATTYNLAQGGRIIDFPVGDLLNGVYSSLNMLLDQQQFPQVDNIQEQFLPNNFYDARVRVSYPILNRSLYTNNRVQNQQVKLEEYEIAIYQAELTKNIKQAYYNYCLAHTALEILENSQKLVIQNLKDNCSLMANGKALPAQVMRAESEMENIKAQLAEAKKNVANTGHYINFLLNKDLESPIVFESQETASDNFLNVSQMELTGTRAEIAKLQTAEKIQIELLHLNQNYAIPTISTFLDLGLQGFDFQVNNQSRYYLFGLQLNMPIYQAGRNKRAITRSKLKLETLEIQKRQTQNGIAMRVKNLKNTIQSAVATKQSATANLKSATAYLNLINKGYKEGIYSLLEFIDARNQYTNASLQVSIAHYSLLNAIADLEREFTYLN